MRREFDALLGVGDTTGDATFEEGLARLKRALAAESRLSRAVEALREIAATTGCMKNAESDPFRPLAMMPWEDGPAVYQTPFCGSCSSCIARAVLVEVEK